jgi:hypothetical protein
VGKMTKARDEFACGMAVAAGIIMQGWGDDVLAEEILSNAGLTTVRAMREAGVETYDIKLCAPVLHIFRERERSKAARSALEEHNGK